VTQEKRKIDPYTLHVRQDDREKVPLILSPPLPREHLRVARLWTGDYTLYGTQSRVCEVEVAGPHPLDNVVSIERKRPAELFHTVGKGRRRFLAELTRLAAINRAGGYACILVEGTLASIYRLARDTDILAERRVSPATVVASLASWSVHHGVPVWFAGGQEEAARLALDLLAAAAEKVGWKGPEG